MSTIAQAQALLAQARLQEAEAAFRALCAASPGDAHAWLGLGRALDRQNRTVEAIAAFQSACDLAPEWAEAQRFLGASKVRAGDILAGLACLERAVALEPSHTSNHVALSVAYQQLNDHEGALRHLRRALELSPRSAALFSAYLFELAHHPGLSAAEVFREHVRYGETFGGHSLHVRHVNAPEPDRRLRVGYVSGDFYQHTAMLFLLPVLTRHDRSRHEIFAYANVFRPDAMTEKLTALVSHWRPINALSDEAAAALIRDDQIDILVDLSGHTDSNRLPVFTYRPAPVQANWLGYPATTGLREIDYKIVNGATRTDREAFFTERLYRMPTASTCFNPPVATPAPGPPPALANGIVTFGSFNAPRKMSLDVVLIWAAIMREVPRSRLFLKYTGLHEPVRCRWFIEAFAAHGVTADRLQFEGHSPYAEHLRAYDRVDVGLDPFPYWGGATTRNALWCGVPVITLDARHASPTAALLANMGLDICIAPNERDYIAQAVAVATDVERLTTWRHELRPKLAASDHFNAESFTRSLENAFRTMWVAWCVQRGSAIPTS
jgi:protein O-GlcNAc transferase